MESKITARCQCGKVQFTAPAEPIQQVCCHCADCRDATGAAHSNIAFFKTRGATLSGALTKNNYVAASGNNTSRAKCSACNTFMFDSSEGFIGLIGVFSRTIQQPFVDAPSCHVWVKSKLATTELSEDMPRHETDIPGSGAAAL